MPPAPTAPAGARRPGAQFQPRRRECCAPDEKPLTKEDWIEVISNYLEEGYTGRNLLTADHTAAANYRDNNDVMAVAELRIESVS